MEKVHEIVKQHDTQPDHRPDHGTDQNQHRLAVAQPPGRDDAGQPEDQPPQSVSGAPGLAAGRKGCNLGHTSMGYSGQYGILGKAGRMDFTGLNTLVPQWAQTDGLKTRSVTAQVALSMADQLQAKVEKPSRYWPKYARLAR